MKKKSILSLVLAGVLTIGALSACGNDNANQGSGTQSSESAATEEAQEPEETGEAEEPAGSSSDKDTLIVATENDIPTLHPWDHTAAAASRINLLSFEGLYRINMELEPIPTLIEYGEPITDTEWEFKLFEGIMFHNGEEMTTEDVYASLYATKNYSPSFQYTESVESVEIIDDYTFRITTGQPATLLYDLAHHANYIVPKSLIEADHDFANDPVGSGPYMLTNWYSGDRLEFVAFEDYHNEERKAKIPNVVVRVIPEGASRAIALETGEVDYVVEVPTTDIENLENHPNLEMQGRAATTFNYIMVNNEMEPFNNPLVRRAINLAIDKEAVVEVATNGISEVSISQTPAGFVGSTEENADVYDVELAREVLAESGVDPNSFVFNIICSNDTKRRAAEIIQANLLDIGVTASIESMDLTTYLEVTTGTDYVAAIGGYTAAHMMAFIQGTHYSGTIGASNRSRYRNDEVDALLEQSLVTADDVERAKMLEECAALINLDTPQIPLYQDRLFRAYHKDLGGVQFNAQSYEYFNEMYWK